MLKTTLNKLTDPTNRC